MRHIASFAATLAAPVRAGMVEDCGQDRDQDLKIGGCTAVNRSGEYSGEDLAAAYYNRGIAYDPGTRRALLACARDPVC